MRMGTMRRGCFSILAGIALNLATGDISLAADMAVKSPPALVGAPWSWTGLYIGVNAGGSIGRNTTNNNFIVPGLGSLPESYTVSPAGFVGGGQIGYNWQFSPNWLFGVEGDFQGTSQKETATTGFAELVTTQKQSWFATARARFGYTNGNWLWYATGGGAWGDIKQDFAVLFGPGGAVAGSVSNSSTNSGWTAGGGVETHLWGNWTAKAEYLYLNLGSGPSGSFVDAIGDTLTITSKIHDHTVRAGVNYKFN